MSVFGEIVVEGVKFLRVPAGKFRMGSDGPNALGFEKPEHDEEITHDFYMMETGVTNELYLRFCEATKRAKPYYHNNKNFNRPQQPVVGVTWYDAKAFAEWMTTQLPEEYSEWVCCLPTEAQREYAARGPENNTYPWGNEPPTTELACYYSPDQTGPADVGSHPKGASWCGILDLAGNVWEWCKDEWHTYSQKLKAWEANK